MAWAGPPRKVISSPHCSPQPCLPPSGSARSAKGLAMVPSMTLRPTPALRRRPYRAAPVAAALEPRRLLAAVNWDGGGNGTDWNDALNWSTNAFPGINDDVTIDIPGDPSIRLASGNFSVRSYVIRENFTLQIGSLQAAQASAIRSDFTFISGTMTGAGDVLIGGPFTWSGGTMTGTGTTTIGPASTATFNTASTKSLADRTLDVAGTVNHEAGSLQFSPVPAAGTLNVNAGGVYNAQGEADLTHNAGGGTNLVNVLPGGTFNKTGVGTTLIGSQVTFSNNGTANVDAGTLEFDGTLNNAGPLAVDAGATVLNEGTATFSAGTSFPG